jgi:hypothetical protein
VEFFSEINFKIIIKMSFIQTIKRFFEPIKYKKKVSILGCIIYAIWAIDRIIHVIFLERVIFFLESHNKESFIFMIQLYAGYLIFYTIFIYFTRHK